MTELFALGSAALIGAVDFLGGVLSRRAPAVRVAALVQLVGLCVALPLALLADWKHVAAADIAWAAGCGLVTAVGLWIFYVAMARGLLSIVVPVAAVTGAILPVVYGITRGERPGAIALAGIALALTAIAAASLVPGEGGTHVPTIGLAVVSGVLFGCFYIGYAQVGEGSGLWPVVALRGTAGTLLLCFALVATGGITIRRDLTRPVLAMGAMEAFVSVALLLAYQGGTVAITSVLASLYPVTTVLLAAVVLRERLSRPQLAAVALALVAIVLVSTG